MIFRRSTMVVIFVLGLLSGLAMAVPVAYFFPGRISGHPEPVDMKKSKHQQGRVLKKGSSHKNKKPEAKKEVKEIPVNTNDPKIKSGLLKEDIVIKKDELLFSKKYKLIKLEKEMQLLAGDSLLEEISGISKKNKDSVLVEFWFSPIHYKGYKMANHKLVLFGLSHSADNIALYQLHDEIYLHHFEDFYQIANTFAFQPLDRLLEGSTLAELSKNEY